MHVAWTLPTVIGLVVLGGVCPCALADAPTEQALRAGLCSPLQAVRLRTQATLGRTPDRARPLARGWVVDPRPDVRAQAWALLSLVGDADDVPLAIRATSTDTEGVVASAAARATLALSARYAHTAGPWLARNDAVSPAGTRVFALALVPLLREQSVPRALLHLGERTVAWLEQAYRIAPTETRVRDNVVRCLGRIGTDRARAVLASYAGDAFLSRHVWFQALREAGPSKELDPVHEWIAVLAQGPVRGRGWPSGRSWHRRAREALYRFMAACPDDRWAAIARPALRQVVRKTSWHASLVVAAARALVVLGTPSDEELELCVDAGAEPPWPRNRPGRFEGLGDVFRVLRPYRERGALQDALRGRDGSAVPRSSRAWITLLSDEGSAQEAHAQAVALMEAQPPLVPCQRAGARVLEHCGGPTPSLVHAFLSNEDAWLRAWAVRWAHRLLPDEEATAALRAGVADDQAGVALVSAERLPDAVGDRALLRRLVGIAVEHSSPTTRARAWRFLERATGALASENDNEDDTAAALPRGDAPLDERLRAAARIRAWLASSPKGQDPKEGLPAPGGQGR